MKTYLFLAVLLASQLSFAEECANTISGLKNLVGNPTAAMNWTENSQKNPLDLKLSQGAGVINLKLSKQGQSWADITGVVCKVGVDSYVAPSFDFDLGTSCTGNCENGQTQRAKDQNAISNNVESFGFDL